MLARIFSPPRNAMQSGKGKIGCLVLEYRARSSADRAIR